MAPVGLLRGMQLRQLLFSALSDGPTYSALVPWVLDSEHKGLTLLQHAQERQCLQHVQLQAGDAVPQDMQQCLLQVVGEVCQHAAALPNDACSQAAATACAATGPPATTAPLQPSRTSNGAPQQQGRQQPQKAGDSSSAATCSLSAQASRLAKLHGHLLSHLAAPNLAEQLHLLLLLLTGGPLGTQGTSAAGGSKHQEQQPSAAVDSPQQLLSCRCCAAKYAGKALECCSKLLTCMPVELQQALVCSTHLQHYSPALTAMLSKILAAGGGSGPPGGAAAASLPAAATPWQHKQQQQGGAECTPASAGASSAGRPGVLGWAAAATPGSAGSGGGGAAWLTDSHRSLPGSGSKGGVRQPNRTHASARLSGLGLLMPNTPGSSLAGRPASAGQLPAGGKAAKTAAVCNREKSRDLFFTILRRASSRLDVLRQTQEAAAAAAQDCPQEAAAAEAAAAADMAELLSEVSVAAKQLLLQLAPSNLAYLSELFMACVLQAASTGEPLLEPALVLIAEKDPGRFQKLQQRLADRPSGPAAGSSPAGSTGAPGSVSSNRQAARTGSFRQQQQPARQSAQQVVAPDSGPAAVGGSSLSAGRGDGLLHVVHARARGRPAKQQQPHILATAGAAASQRPMAAANGPSSGSGAQKHLMPQRHILPQANNCAHSQPQQGSAGQQVGTRAGAAHSNGHMSAASPVPLAASCAADSPLPASCLSPLFAAASDTPLAAVAAHNAARASVCSPLINSSSTAQVVATSALPPGSNKVPEQGSRQPVGAGSSISSTAKPAVTSSPAVGDSAGPLHKPGAATTLAKASRPPAGAAGGASGPHSAPPKLQAAQLSNTASGPGAALAQHGTGPAQVMLQLLQLMPADQHVLVLLLHAADSASFNRVLLGVVCSRVEKLLSSSPASFTAASGLGQQASAVVALGTYCSYLAFAAGAAEPTDAAAAGSSQAESLLQQQPMLDVAAMLQRLLAGTVSAGARSSGELQQQSGGSELDTAWRLALAVPFAVSCMRLAGLSLGAANSPCMQAALHTLHALRRLPALSPTTPGFGALPICVACSVLSCQAGQVQPAAAAAGAGLSSRADELSRALASGSCLVDGSYWSICCPGLQQLISTLHAASAAVGAPPSSASTAAPVSLTASALRAQQQQQHCQQQQQDKAAGDAEVEGQAATAAAHSSDTSQAPQEHAGVDATTVVRQAGAAVKSGQQTHRPAVPAAPAGAGAGRKAQGSTNSSPSGAAAAARHTTPLLLAPRGPPEVPSPPAVMLEALAAVSDPVRQQLQQAFISQYSTDDNPVKMCDVLTVINGILFANSVSKALSQGLPGVLQRHLDLLQQSVQQQLTPTAHAAGGGGTAQLQGQDLARAVHSLYTQQLGTALSEALEAAMQAAADHAGQAAAAACGALLPAGVPPAAATTAAALVTASCKASCAQRLLQEVPVLVQSTLADAADDLVRLVNRQWAVHTRMTAGTASGTGTVTRTDSSSSIRAAGSADAKQRVRVQPVKLEGVAAAPGARAAATGQQRSSDEAVQQESRSAAQAIPQSSSDGHMSAVPAGRQASGLTAAGSNRRAVTSGVSQPAASEAVSPPPSKPGLPAAVGGPAGSQGAVCFTDTSAAAAQAPDDPAGAAAAQSSSSSPAGLIDEFLSTQLSPCSQVRDELQGQEVASSLTAAAEAAAQQLLSGVTDGHFSMGEVERQLLQALQHAQAAVQAAVQAAQLAGSSHASTADGRQQVSAAEHGQHLLLLLAGALVHALLCCPRTKAAVWAIGCTAHTERATACPDLPYLTQLPVQLMKAVRGDVPVWLLRALRHWLQSATLLSVHSSVE